MAEPLSDDQIASEITDLSGWTHENDKLSKEFNFANFRDAVTFINRIAFEADEQAHHPEIFNVYSTVQISLCTHDAGDKVTNKDIKLANSIESLYNK